MRGIGRGARVAPRHGTNAADHKISDNSKTLKAAHNSLRTITHHDGMAQILHITNQYTVRNGGTIFGGHKNYQVHESRDSSMNSSSVHPPNRMYY
eukprot:scaffold136448_cov40-Tisochrysis_lutea.AAC.1